MNPFEPICVALSIKIVTGDAENVIPTMERNLHRCESVSSSATEVVARQALATPSIGMAGDWSGSEHRVLQALQKSNSWQGRSVSRLATRSRRRWMKYKNQTVFHILGVFVVDCPRGTRPMCGFHKSTIRTTRACQSRPMTGACHDRAAPFLAYPNACFPKVQFREIRPCV